MVKMLCALLVFSFQVRAAFQTIWNGYLESETYKVRNLSDKDLKLKYMVDNSLTNWQLNFIGTYSDDKLQNLNRFAPNQTLVDGVSAAIIKPTLNFGTFSLEHIHTHYDLSNWDPSFKVGLDSDQQYDVMTKIGYEYDFFNNKTKSQTTIIKKNFEQEMTLASLERESEYLDVFTKFIEAKMSLFQIRLSRENLKKSLKRYRTIKRRVKVGSSRKVDLYLAEGAYLSKREEIEKAKQDFEEKLSILEYILGRNINKQLFSYVSWDEVPELPQMSKREQSLDVQLLEKRLALSKANLDQIKQNSGYRLTLNLGYETNAINSGRGDALSGNFEDNNRKQASLNLIIPLGVNKNKALKSRLSLERKLTEKRLNNKKGEIKIKIKTLERQLKFSRFAFKDATSKTKVLRLALKETEKLYSRGQSNFDELIRREEDYINSQLSEKVTLARLELIIANLAFLTGNIKDYLDGYRD